MKYQKSIIRKSHFLGTKIRNLRKRNHLTIEDLSARCIKINPDASPSVSYLSMIERGKRFPSIDMLTVIATIFQKDVDWFLDGKQDEQAITPQKGSRGGITGMALEPGFLFSNDILQIAIPEMLSQTGTTGREFAHLLIRAHQEHQQNHFPDLERAAEEIGKKQLPLSHKDLLATLEQMGISIRWFKKIPKAVEKEVAMSTPGLVSSFFEPPATLYLNELLKKHTRRLKYDLAVHIAHNVLHNKDVFKCISISSQQNQHLKQTIYNHQLSTQRISFMPGEILSVAFLREHCFVRKSRFVNY